MKYIWKFNSQKLSGAVYIPIDLIDKSSVIKQIIWEYVKNTPFTYHPKERVPVHIIVEVLETKIPLRNTKMSVSCYEMSNLLNVYQK